MNSYNITISHVVDEVCSCIEMTGVHFETDHCIRFTSDVSLKCFSMGFWTMEQQMEYVKDQFDKLIKKIG